MYFLQSLGPEVENLNRRAKEVAQELCARATPLQTGAKIPSHQDVFSAPERKGKVYRLVDGTLSCSRGDKILFYFDPGDLVGVEHSLIGTTTKILSDFAVVVDCYDAQALIHSAHASPELSRLWTEYLALQQGMLTALVGNLFKDEISAPPEINMLMEGSPIAEEGSRAEQVHLIIEGSVDVLIQGVPEEVIGPGELLGVVPVLSGIPWSVTLQARETSVVMSLPRENFIHLVESRPSAYLKQIEEMARLLVDMGDRQFKVRLGNF